MISLEEVLKIHNILIEKFGGSPGIRNRELLESSIGRPFSTFDSIDLYPTPIDKGAAIIESIVKNHPFIDGNKRTGFNGKERDPASEWGQTSYDYGARIYNPEIAKFLSVDPLSKDLAHISPYQYSENRPIDHVDKDGEKKIYYLKLIDGDKVTILVIVNKGEIEQFTKQHRESIGVRGVPMPIYTSPYITNTYTYDQEQTFILNKNTGQFTALEEIRTEKRDNSATVRSIQDNWMEFKNFVGVLDDLSNGGGGIVFTSVSGQGQETRDGYNADGQSENIDMLMAVLNAANTAASSSAARNLIQIWKRSVDYHTIINDIDNNLFKLENKNPDEKNSEFDTIQGPTIEDGDKKYNSKIIKKNGEEVDTLYYTN